VLYPEQGITKQTLAEYYAAVSEHMLPHVVERPLTLVRCPEGRDKQCFYQKHANESMPDIIRRVPIKEGNGNAELYLAIDDVAALIALVQLGVLEFHLWGCRIDKLDRPDLLIFDLDPDTALPWKDVRAAALLLRELLQQLELQSFVKSTGGKGLHVVIPIVRRTSWDDAKSFTRAVAEVFVKEWPERFTATMSKKRRTGKIFIDYLRNAPNATAIAPYSTRARPGAPVAAPLHWNEVTDSKQRPEYTIETLPRRLARLKHDPWEGFFDLRQTINKAMIRKILA
jgi:bifunctional non-homologous end joining protein LigD